MRIIRKAELERLIGKTERTIRVMEAEGTFPKRFVINPGGRDVGWLESEVHAWIEQRAASRAAA